ncbi:uncharacterized protein LOC117182158 [Belonocnema kinseyi]|uniref:uncharacterized protein LOC117182158 n=1 Tax=Belonocnema kinseyi TaxID=2817044 RepID=UPI00143D3C22|nr:uncharacterized protein LOC117182158 [Belonocnema kinseyi]
MIRLLFEDLLSIENMRYMSIGGRKIRQERRKYMKLPEEIYSAVLAYTIQQCNSLNCGNTLFNSQRYHDFVTYVFSEARQGISRKNKLKQNEIGSKTEKEDVLFPCIIQNEDKVELVPGSNVWISKNNLCEIKEKCEAISCESKHQKMIYYLLKVLLDTENLSVARTNNGRNNYFRVPRELITTVIVYATRKCNANCDALPSAYNAYMSSIINHVRAISERRNSSDFEYNNEMTSISNTEEDISFAENKPEHSLDENSFGRTFVKLEINSTQTPTIQKRGREDEENDSTIRNKRTKLSEDTAIRDLENYCSTSYDQIPLNHVQLNNVPTSVSQNLEKIRESSYNEIPVNPGPSSALKNLENFYNRSFVLIPSNHVSGIENLTGNLDETASIPSNVGADYYDEAVHNSFLVNDLETIAEHSV